MNKKNRALISTILVVSFFVILYQSSVDASFGSTVYLPLIINKVNNPDKPSTPEPENSASTIIRNALESQGSGENFVIDINNCNVQPGDGWLTVNNTTVSLTPDDVIYRLKGWITNDWFRLGYHLFIIDNTGNLANVIYSFPDTRSIAISYSQKSTTYDISFSGTIKDNAIQISYRNYTSTRINSQSTTLVFTGTMQCPVKVLPSDQWKPGKVTDAMAWNSGHCVKVTWDPPSADIPNGPSVAYAIFSDKNNPTVESEIARVSNDTDTYMDCKPQIVGYYRINSVGPDGSLGHGEYTNNVVVLPLPYSQELGDEP